MQTFGELVDPHISDMQKIGKAPGRSKRAAPEMLKVRLGRKTLVEMNRECVIKFGRARALEGAGPTTLGIDAGVLKLVMRHVAAVHGLPSRSSQSTKGYPQLADSLRESALHQMRGFANEPKPD